MSYVLRFDEIDKSSLPLVGGKCASLGELIKAGFRVPPGFAVTTTSYLKFITATGIKDTIREILSTVRLDDIVSINAASVKIRNLFERAQMPKEIDQEIRSNYLALCKACRIEDIPVAVRSSATAEDVSTASFAGQQETFL